MGKACVRPCGASMTMCVVLAAVLSGCFTDTIVGNGGSSSGEPPQCREDADCAFFDADQDACTSAVCQAGRCAQRLLRGTAECQCHSNVDCTFFQKDCSSGVCTAHQCSEKLAPPGPAPKQEAGNCQTLVCDGATATASVEADPMDVPNDDNPCTVESCEASGPKKTTLEDGAACGDGVCFGGRCLTCKPANAASCGGEGNDEPRNNSASTASPMTENAPFCAFSSGSDVDWYTFYAKDAELSHDVFSFRLWSTAPTIELCIYVKCEKGGTPGGGCSTKVAGPDGSLGCCFQGAPSALRPSWDLDCPGTNEDSGTTYVSVRTPGASACETYALTGGY